MESVYGLAHSRGTECPESSTEANKIMCLIIDTVVLLVNSCKIGNLQNVQQELARNVLSLLYKIWKKTQPLRSSTDCNKWKNKLQSKEYEISKSIFRLSTGLASPAWPEPDVVRKSIFGETVSDFETFVLAYWEKLPNLYRRKQATKMDSLVFVTLHNDFNLGTTPDSIIESLLQGLVSCPAIASDELDIDSFLHEVHDSLGDSVKYRQDIRVMRTRDPDDQTSRGCVTEEHFFDDGTIFTDEDAFIEKCKHAFKNGNSIALRGMEFRSEKVAAIASALAGLFGQPSVGANIYFSPARSQGLARHYDDHCVLVWQLLGSKKWTVWPNPKPLLPRLYEPFDPLDGNLDESSGRVEVLHEGDMMYIPRGYVHEARTDASGSEVNDCSLHLTLAIEVEAPFEWEGFAHIALHCWAEKQQLRGSQSVEFEGKAGASLSAIVLHLAIRLLSDSEPVFRKACMVAAKASTSSSSCTSTTTHLEALRSSQRSTFDEILRKIDQSCSIKEALERIASAVRERDDGAFQWMSWLRHLPQQGTAAGYIIDFCNILGALEALVEAFDSDPGQALDGLTAFKSGFCRRVAYEDACEAFGTLLEMYRVARTQYMRGMLALHGAGAHVS